jgi:iron(III) transport system ATP-binding protein
MSQPVPGVELRSVTKIFQDPQGREVVAADNVSFTVPRGELVTLLGPSGCGKTTLLRMIGGFEHQTRGEIFIDGQSAGLTPPNKRNTSMVFQSYALFPHMTVFDNVAYGPRLKKMPAAEIRAKVLDIMGVVGLGGMESRTPGQLSGGQQQRVALARALVNEPSVLLFDEPLSNLDAKLRVQMREEIRRVQTTLGITSVYVTHDQEEAVCISDRIVVLRAGRIEQQGSPREIYERPASRFVAGFFGKVNFVPAAVTAVDGDALTVDMLGASLRVTQPGHGLREGVKTHAALRPEAASVLPEGGIPATLAKAVYMGHAVEYTVEAAGAAVTVAQPNPMARGVLSQGTRVGLHLEPASLHILPPE